MGEGNADTARAWVGAYNRRDLDGLLDLSDPDIEFKSAFAAIESGGVFRGATGVADYFRTIDDAYEAFQVIIEEVLDAGPAAALVAGRAEWVGRGSGAAGSTPIFPAMWFRAGKALRVETLPTREEGQRAVGLDPTK